MRLFKGNKKNQHLSLQLNKSAPGTEGWQSMLQVPSTSQDQLQDQYNDMIQIHGGKWDGGGGGGAAVFQMFTVTQFKQV